MTTEQVVGYLLEDKGLAFLRESLSWAVQQLMEAEVSELVGAARGERAREERSRPSNNGEMIAGRHEGAGLLDRAFILESR